jgi:diadenylate cyclase
MQGARERETRAQQVVKGFGMLIVAAQVSRWLKLSAMFWLLDYFINAGAIVLVILFQPELRQALERVGRGSKIFNNPTIATPETNMVAVVHELVRAVQEMASQKVGALLVIQQDSPIGDIIETGTRLDARISAQLIENIFTPNTPLHDGAMIIRGDTLVAAGCILPLTDSPDISPSLGTRHRAALGMSEHSDAVIIVASEETGIISLARGGKLIRYLDSEGLRRILMEIYAPEQSIKGINSLLHWRSRHEKRP